MRDILILAIAFLLTGILLCFRGLSLFKFLSMILSALAFGMIGLRLQSYFGYSWLYIVVGILAVLGGILGFKKYKFGVFLCCSFMTFIVVFSAFWRRVTLCLHKIVGDIVDTTTLLKVYVRSILCGTDVKESLEGLTNFSFSNYSVEFEEISALVKKGLLWAFIASLVVGLLSLLLVDFFIITMTASSGATILSMFLSVFIPIAGPWYTFSVVTFTILGMVLQFGHKGRRRRK